MITLEAHIEKQYGGNITAFAKAHNRSRPLIYRWIASGALWINGQAFDPVTEKPDEVPVWACTECMLVNPLSAHTCTECGHFGGLLSRGEWKMEDGEISIDATFHSLEVTLATLNAADLVAMTEALQNGT